MVQAAVKSAAGIACGALVLCLAGCAGPRAAAYKAAGPAAPAAAPAHGAYTPDPALAGAAGVINYSYEAGRDAAADIKLALGLAAATRRSVLVEVGGPWCSWCGIMDAFFAAEPEALALRDAAFVTVKVYSRPSAPEPALAAYPPVAGYPHLYVLSADGAVLESRDTTTLEAGEGYDAAKMAAFLRSYEPGKFPVDTHRGK